MRRMINRKGMLVSIGLLVTVSVAACTASKAPGSAEPERPYGHRHSGGLSARRNAQRHTGRRLRFLGTAGQRLACGIGDSVRRDLQLVTRHR